MNIGLVNVVSQKDENNIEKVEGKSKRIFKEIS